MYVSSSSSRMARVTITNDTEQNFFQVFSFFLLGSPRAPRYKRMKHFCTPSLSPMSCGLIETSDAFQNNQSQSNLVLVKHWHKQNSKTPPKQPHRHPLALQSHAALLA
jgi:hypothetical protein